MLENWGRDFFFDRRCWNLVNRHHSRLTGRQRYMNRRGTTESQVRPLVGGAKSLAQLDGYRGKRRAMEEKEGQRSREGENVWGQRGEESPWAAAVAHQLKRSSSLRRLFSPPTRYSSDRAANKDSCVFPSSFCSFTITPVFYIRIHHTKIPLPKNSAAVIRALGNG